jgi:hypothetical protein
MNRDDAQSIAILALAYLARDGDRLDRFTGWTGLAVDDLAQAVANPDMLGGVLDYILSDEKLLIAFTEDAAIAPEDPARARRALPGYMPQM